MTRIRAVSKFFFEGDRKFFIKGATYGPFKPDARVLEMSLRVVDRVLRNVDAQNFARFAGQDQMRIMNWIECAAKNPDFFARHHSER